ncbi:uncharacterized protein UV8b_03496 [Ustilaginoidea virens]|uniref:ribonuclease Z n=1 Tax=Ustilaginoidea virens TaxID=1159556 RepID=A0A1B5KQY6_USTVR|nr:uncharacterized protein UV8b_03496 [Ustilaginoidea virens]QUC19255.1 hypothetical protein UV8b_03496 [Ustilaginoidea virens]GAO13108.1 hypothetical protein UVI_02024670 [Ustilaginoidea virens]
MLSTVELATVPSADTPGACIHFHHEKRSYLFGQVVEGTQRAFVSRKISLGRTEQVFLSGSVGWEKMGGLIGYLLSVGGAVDAAKEQSNSDNMQRKQKGKNSLKSPSHPGIDVHGADNLCHMLAAYRAVSFRQSVSVRPHESRQDPRSADPTNTDPDWEDDAIRVWKVPVKRARSSSPTKRRHEEMSNSHVDHDSTDSPRPKRQSTLSDPAVAENIVERIMFSGSFNSRPVLLPRKVRHLKPTDIAVLRKGGMLKQYTGPFISDGQDLPNPDERAWVFPKPGDSGEAEKNVSPLAINHFPLERTAYSEISMSYIVKCRDRRGKFNVAVAKECGVEPVDFKLLIEGQPVEGKNGRIVTPEMVLGDPILGKGIIVADIASLDFLDSFMERPEWRTPEMMANISVMYWILGLDLDSDVASRERILRFTEEHAQMKHVFCSRETCPNMITHTGAAEIQAKLRRIDPQRFPLPKFDNRVQYSGPPSGSPVELGRAGMKVQLMPRLVFHDQAVAPFPDLLGSAASVDGDLIALAETAKAQAEDPEFLARVEASEKDIPNRDAEIIPLGTGSSVPSKHRNVSGTLIRVPGVGNYLLDCGEGSLGQIRRLFHPEEAAEVLRNLRCIVISHFHADHHMGTVSVIKAWYEQSLRDQSSASLAISCIGRYRAVLEEISQVEDFGFHRLRFPNCADTNLRDDRDIYVVAAKDLGDENFGLAGIKRVPVPHCWRSFATELELASGLRIAYSGDCRPSSAFAQACRGAHLLVHECTFGDDKQDHAKIKKHSTMAEALGVAREMEARRTLLTHFSQRYSKADSLRREMVEGEEQHVLLAFDMMRVRLGDFQVAACYVPAVQRLMETME